MRFRLPGFLLALVLFSSAEAFADTVRVTVERALVYSSSSGVVVLAQLPRGTIVEAIRRTGDWYAIVLPVQPIINSPDRAGFIRTSQVAVEATGPMSARAARLLSPPTAPSPRARSSMVVLVDGATRLSAKALTRTSTAFTSAYAEDGSISAGYDEPTGTQIGALVSQAVWGPVGVGLGFDYTWRDGAASLAATVPHPFFFDQDRAATFNASGLSEREVAIHIPAVWMPPSFGSMKILVFGGPSFFRVSRELVTDLTLDDDYPYDVVAVAGAVSERRTGSAVGFHAGGDASYFFTPVFGVGGGVRYSRGKLTFKNDTGAVTDGQAGALQVAAGIRLRF